MSYLKYLLLNTALAWSYSGYFMAQYQQSTIELTHEQTLNIPENTEHTFIDYGNNLYFVTKDQIHRKSLATGIQNVQSQKKWQTIDQIISINSMKTVVFSQAQQQVCFTDNTLSTQGSCIQLQDYGLSNVTQVAASKRPDMLWIYDELNSSLVLFNFVQHQILQSVNNLRGLLALKDEPILEENTAGLWIYTKAGQVLRMDDYLNVLSEEQISFSSLVPFKKGYFIIQDQKLIYHSLLKDQIVFDKISTLSVNDKLHISGNQLIIEKNELLEVFIIKEN